MPFDAEIERHFFSGFCQEVFMSFLIALFFSGFAQASVAPGWSAGPAISYSQGIGPWSNELQFSDDGKYVAFLGASGETGITSTADQKTFFPDQDNTQSDWKTHISFLLGSHILLMGGDFHLAYVNADNQKQAALSNGQILNMLKSLGGPDFFHMIGNLVPNPKGDTFVSLDPFTTPVLWNTDSLTPQKILSTPKVSRAVYDSTGKFLITSTPTVSVLDVDKNVVVKELFLNHPFTSVSDIEISGSCVAVAHDFSFFPKDTVPAIEIVDFNSGKMISHLEFKDAQPLEKQKIISMDGSCKTILVTDFQQAKLIDIASGKVLAVFAEHLTDSDQEEDQNHISAGAISKDGKTVAIGYRKVMIFKKH